jgi:hypothetical protein
MTRLDTLRMLRDVDPDGMETEPTPDDYRIFEAWVTTRYGAAMLREYYGNDWDLPRSEHYEYGEEL